MNSRRSKSSFWRILLATVIFYAGFAGAQTISSLKGVAVPTPPNLSTYVSNVAVAKVLGKALFWDMGVGTDDNIQACASCHFHAGADNRAKNQLDPTLNHQTAALNGIFNPTRSGNAGGPNYTVRKADFPFHVLSDPLNRDSTVLFDTDDIMSSQGVFGRGYASGAGCYVNSVDPHFHVGSLNTRKVEPRNTPTTINAVFNFRNFWDGRANNRFNGTSPFGDRDNVWAANNSLPPRAGVYLLNASNAITTRTPISIPNASLASQAVGPPTSDFEMACSTMRWHIIARKLLSNNISFGLSTAGLNQSPRKALAGQAVSSTDSLLAPYRDASGIGLNKTYPELIRLAFPNIYWQGGDPGGPQTGLVVYGTNFTQMEMNLSFFFGLAVQLYESTLVSDDAPIDRFFASPGLAADLTKLTQPEKDGLAIFLGKGKCANCHGGSQLTNAGTPNYDDAQQGNLISRMIMGDGGVAHYDEGFYNIGVRPTIEDIGLGERDPFGRPLSFTRQLRNKLQWGGPFDDPFTVNDCNFEVLLNGTPNTNHICQPSTYPGFRTAVDGAFKVPTLRNVELTGPYFHNGSRKSLEEVVEFYNRGGDRRGPNGNDTTGFDNTVYGENNLSNLDADIVSLSLTGPLSLSTSEQAKLVAFLKRPLTDDRVRCDKAPFDHPELRIPNGHPGNNVSVTGAGFQATDTMLTIPAVGSAGMCGANLSGARLPFDQTLAP